MKAGATSSSLWSNTIFRRILQILQGVFLWFFCHYFWNLPPQEERTLSFIMESQYFDRQINTYFQFRSNTSRQALMNWDSFATLGGSTILFLFCALHWQLAGSSPSYLSTVPTCLIKHSLLLGVLSSFTLPLFNLFPNVLIAFLYLCFKACIWGIKH